VNRDPYAAFLGQRSLFAAGTEKGKLIVADITDGLDPISNPFIKTKQTFDAAT